MAEPFEIMAVPFDVYLAPEGTARPDLADDPNASGSGWTLLGVRGADEYDEAGITVTHDQSVNVYRGLRGTVGVKAFRTSEDLKIGFTLNDLTMESYGKVINDANVDDTGDTRALTLYQGDQVATFALLMRSVNGPYGDGAPCQLWTPKVYQSASPAVVHRKGTPAGLALEFMALKYLDAADDSEIIGVFEAMDTPLP